MFNLTDHLVGTAVGAIDAATRPVRDGLDVLEGLTEGELRKKAALRLGADVVAGMAFAEVVEYLRNA